MAWIADQWGNLLTVSFSLSNITFKFVVIKFIIHDVNAIIEFDECLIHLKYKLMLTTTSDNYYAHGVSMLMNASRG